MHTCSQTAFPCTLDHQGLLPAVPGAILHMLLHGAKAAMGALQNAARMLLRVAAELAAFQQHAAAVLTSTVVECHRAGLAGAAYRHAAQLMQPGLKAGIPAAYKRKIEGLVRRREM